MQSSPASCHFLPLRSKYSSQHPVLKDLPHLCSTLSVKDEFEHWTISLNLIWFT
jgi:hypothetical protein